MSDIPLRSLAEIEADIARIRAEASKVEAQLAELDERHDELLHEKRTHHAYRPVTHATAAMEAIGGCIAAGLYGVTPESAKLTGLAAALDVENPQGGGR